jgi:hypothetical protein
MHFFCQVSNGQRATDLTLCYRSSKGGVDEFAKKKGSSIAISVSHFKEESRIGLAL